MKSLARGTTGPLRIMSKSATPSPLMSPDSQVSPFLHHIPDIYELFKVLDSLKTEMPAAAEVTT